SMAESPVMFKLFSLNSIDLPQQGKPLVILNSLSCVKDCKLLPNSKSKLMRSSSDVVFENMSSRLVKTLNCQIEETIFCRFNLFAPAVPASKRSDLNFVIVERESIIDSLM